MNIGPVSIGVGVRRGSGAWVVVGKARQPDQVWRGRTYCLHLRVPSLWQWGYEDDGCYGESFNLSPLSFQWGA